MKKILLIAINARYSHSNLALRYLRETVSDLDHHVILKEFSINQKIATIIDSIEEESPDVIALSVYIWNSDMVKDLITLLEKKRIPLVCGGPEVSYNPEKWLAASSAVTWIITGPGEGAFRKLAASDFTLPGGILADESIPFNKVPFPYHKEDLANLKNRYIYYESSRGCPFRCSYCLSSRKDQKLQLRDTAQVKKEIAFLVKEGAGTIKFVDRSFNADRIFSREIWRYCIETFSPEEAHFHFEVFPSLLEEEDFTLLSETPDGLFQFEIGIQSIHDQTLKEISRPGSWSDIEAKVQRIIAMGTIHVHVDLIAGLPFEDYHRVRASFNALARLGAEHLQLGFLKVLPGTAMAACSEPYGIEHEPAAPYGILKNRWLTGDEIIRLKDMARLLDIYGNSHKYKNTINELTACFPEPFLLWETLSDMGKEVKADSTPETSWETRAALLLSFAEKHFPQKKIFFKDTLRWDWILLTKRHRFPSLLDDGTVSGPRKEIIFTLQNENSRLAVTPPGISWSTEELRRAVIFLPATKIFQDRYLGGDDVCLILPSQNITFSFKKSALENEEQ